MFRLIFKQDLRNFRQMESALSLVFKLSHSLFRLHFHRKGKTSKSLPFWVFDNFRNIWHHVRKANFNVTHAQTFFRAVLDHCNIYTDIEGTRLSLVVLHTSSSVGRALDWHVKVLTLIAVKLLSMQQHTLKVTSAQKITHLRSRPQDAKITRCQYYISSCGSSLTI